MSIKNKPDEVSPLASLITCIIFVIGFVALYNCSGSSNSSPKKRQLTHADYIYHTKRGLEKRLKDADSAEYRGVKVYHHPDKIVVCGEVNAKNSFGGFTGYQPFLGSGDLVVMPDDMAAGEFEKSYWQLCR